MLHMFTVLGSHSTVFTDESLSVWKKTWGGGGRAIFLIVAFTIPLTSAFLHLSICSAENPHK
jgi:hypothetical protein